MKKKITFPTLLLAGAPDAPADRMEQYIMGVLDNQEE